MDKIAFRQPDHSRIGTRKRRSNCKDTKSEQEALKSKRFVRKSCRVRKDDKQGVEHAREHWRFTFEWVRLGVRVRV